MTTPIVIVAFGTTTHAQKTYAYMNQRFKSRFADHEIRWAFSSRMVKEHSNKRSCKHGAKHSMENINSKSIDSSNSNYLINIQSPTEVLQELYEQGHSWAVVQSLHIINAHELYRLVDEAKTIPIRTSIGLPLLTSYSDYTSLADSMISKYKSHISEEEAVVFVGHGTDHPSWSSYLAFESIMRNHLNVFYVKHNIDYSLNQNPSYQNKIFMGLIEGEPEQPEIIEAVIKSGAKKVYLVPFTLVAGVHFKEDIAGSEDSWKSAFEDAGLSVEIEQQGIGYQDSVIDIFMEHIQEAFSIIHK
ncbi:MAG: sirohydrochlorin cobaltochelatase [Desulfamplus sp.]|nr:sirohydrochlorin cobaltochelatase [Desulfamplus sp.]